YFKWDSYIASVDARPPFAVEGRHRRYGHPPGIARSQMVGNGTLGFHRSFDAVFLLRMTSKDMGV
ncbi:MAG: hypothetical protein LUF35_12665, partial [Lachnospiraceae bacterium]|nr:hypothetical protein [Lachnospiraceae bacterium]